MILILNSNTNVHVKGIPLQSLLSSQTELTAAAPKPERRQQSAKFSLS